MEIVASFGFDASSSYYRVNLLNYMLGKVHSYKLPYIDPMNGHWLAGFGKIPVPEGPSYTFRIVGIVMILGVLVAAMLPQCIGSAPLPRGWDFPAFCRLRLRLRLRPRPRPRGRRDSRGGVPLGTPEARLLYHAGMVARATGDHERKRELLARALALSPAFDPVHAPLRSCGRDAAAGSVRAGAASGRPASR